MKPQILIIDDCEFVCDAFKKILGTDFLVETSTNPHETLLLLEKFKPQVLLIDLFMPSFHGIELYKTIKKANQEAARIPIAFLSSSLDDQLFTEALELGANDFISKLDSYPRIIARIQKLVKLNSGRLIGKDIIFFESDCCLRTANRKINLTRTESRIISLLLDSSNVVLRDDLVVKIWPETNVVDKTVNTHLTNLRRKMHPLGASVRLKRSGIIVLDHKYSGL